MKYAIVGFGRIGQAVARAFARRSMDVVVAGRRSPETLAPQARTIGPTVVAKSLRDRDTELGGSMSTDKDIQTVKDFFAAIGSGDSQKVLTLVVVDFEWAVPGKDWPLAGTHRGHAGLASILQKASDEIETNYPKPPEFVAAGDRVFRVGVATGKIKATGKPFKDEFVFDILVQNGKLMRIKEYVDTQALAEASK